MATLSNGDWRRVRAAYVEGRETIEAIASRFGVSASAISRRRKFEGWPPRRNAMPAQAECIASAQAQPDGIEPHDGETAPGDLIQRFYNLIKLKLGHMEEDMANREDRTPADNERDTRALGTLIRNFEKVFGLERGQGNDDDTATGRGARGHDEQAEAEAIRRELAERLVRLRNTNRKDGGGTGGDAG
jgi:hypothetical protein